MMIEAGTAAKYWEPEKQVRLLVGQVGVTRCWRR